MNFFTLPHFCFLLLTTFLFCSCSLRTGRTLYGRCKPGYFACLQIEINSDGTFEEYSFFDVGGASIIKGRWEYTSKDTIVLNSLKQPEFSYSSSENQEDSLTIKVYNKELYPAVFCLLLLNNDSSLVGSTNMDGICKFPKVGIDQVEIFFLGKSYTIKIEHPKHNQLDIIADIEYLSSFNEYIINKKMLLKRNKLIGFSSYDSSRYSLKREKMSKRQWKE